MKNNINVIYNDLIKLTSDSEVFYFMDYPLVQGFSYRIFDYRLSVYKDFLLPSAKESRGIMFLLKDEEMIDLVARPMAKFFNYKENPESTFDCNLSEISQVNAKEDGSLISSYIHIDNSIKLKSKGSISSDQANAANAYFNAIDDIEFKSDMFYLTSNEYTVNLEWTAPDNCVVLRYNEPRLIVLNVRHRYTGEYMSLDEIKKFKGISRFLVDTVTTLDLSRDIKFSSLVNEIKGMTHIEGFIFKFNNAWVKVKTDWYCNLHTQKDSISSDKRLFFAFLDSHIDDLRQLVDNDPYFTERLDKSELHFSTTCNRNIKLIHDTYDAHKHLGTAKEFALAIKDIKDDDVPYLFSMCMLMYRKQDFEPELKRQFRLNYQKFLKGLYED